MCLTTRVPRCSEDAELPVLILPGHRLEAVKAESTEVAIAGFNRWNPFGQRHHVVIVSYRNRYCVRTSATPIAACLSRALTSAYVSHDFSPLKLKITK